MSGPGSTTRARTIVSLSSDYGVGSVEERRAKHFTGYQDGLAEAAARLGHRFEVVGPSGTEGPAPQGLADAAHRRLDRGDVDLAMVYEGRLEHLEVFARVAADHPRTRVLVNLFKSEHPLDLPRERGDRRRDRTSHRRAVDGSVARLTERLARLALPTNLVITAETERRALLARSLGLRIGGAWPVHSQLAEAAEPVPTARPPDGSVRVLVQVPWHKANPATLREVGTVIRAVVRLRSGDGRVRFSIAGRFADRPRLARRVRRLAGDGVTVIDRSLDDDAYRELHDAHDVVWLPVRGAYNVQSSGKALDGLVRGLPVLAPAGSYGATEQVRWVPGAPSYGATTEAIEVLLRLPDLVEVLRAELTGRLDAVRAAYSPVTSVRRLLAISGLEGPDDGRRP
jgi:hypothetical protein